MTVARKDHSCDFCGWRIPKGSEYRNDTLKPWDHYENDGFSTWKIHLLCFRVWELHAHENDNMYPGDYRLFRLDLSESQIAELSSARGTPA